MNELNEYMNPSLIKVLVKLRTGVVEVTHESVIYEGDYE